MTEESFLLVLSPRERQIWLALRENGEFRRFKSSMRDVPELLRFQSEKVILCRLRKKLRKSKLPFVIVRASKGVIKLEEKR